MPAESRELIFPLKGISEGWAFGHQPEGTTPDALNVLPIDAIGSRIRGGQRSGLSKFCTAQLADSAIQEIRPVGRAIFYSDQYTGYIATGYERTLHLLKADYTESGNIYLGASDYAGVETFSRFDKYGNIIFGGSTTKAAATYPNTTVAMVNPSLIVQWTKQLADPSATDVRGHCQHISYNTVLHQILVAVSMNDSYEGATGGEDATHFLLDAGTGAILWCEDFRGANDLELGACYLDDDGTCYITARRNNAWPGAAGTNADMWSITPDLTSPGPGNHTCTVNWYNDTGEVANESPALDIHGDNLFYIDKTAKKLHIINKITKAAIAEQADAASTSLLDGRFLSNGVVVVVRVQLNDQQVYKWVSGVSYAVLFTYSTAGGGFCITSDYLDNIHCTGTDTTTYTGAGGVADSLKYNVAGAFQQGANSASDLARWAGNIDVYDPDETAERYNDVYTVCGGSIYRITPTSRSILPSGTGVLSTVGINVMSAVAYRDVFFVDGKYSVLYDYSDGKVETWTATAGTLPANATIMALYRGRIVLAGRTADPHNWYMSKAGDPFDWDYAPAITTAIQAVAGNNTDAGECPDIITCLAPYSDDLMVMGGDHSIWIMRGDPADRGRIDSVSYQTGIIGKYAFSYDANGLLYFFGNDQVWRMNPGQGDLMSISENRLDSIFRAIDYNTYTVRLSWDNMRDGLHVYFVPSETPTTGTYHYFWHKTTDSWWKIQYPAAMGPTCVAIYDADAADDRAFLSGGYDGYVRQLDTSALSDDDTAISSYVLYPPMTFGGSDYNTRVNRITAILETNSDDVVLTAYAEDTVQRAIESTTIRFVHTLSGGRTTVLKRISGNTVVLKLSNSVKDKTWAIENLVAQLSIVGRTRKNQL